MTGYTDTRQHDLTLSLVWLVLVGCYLAWLV
jgi:hypothetical protein